LKYQVAYAPMQIVPGRLRHFRRTVSSRSRLSYKQQ